jgi:phosphoglycerate dehydrogenase-like enzyme
MSPIVIASQLPPAFNQAVIAITPDVEIVAIPAGVPRAVPKSARVMLAGPIPFADRLSASPLPSGWPFSLEWIQLASTGIDSYPSWLFSGPPVTAARGIGAVALAEFALAAILAEAKRFPELWIDDANRWRPIPSLALVEGTTLGVFGFGAVSEALVPRAQALGMHVLAARRSARPIELPGVVQVPGIRDLVRHVEHLVLAAPLTPATRHIIDRGSLACAKPGLHIVNVARGALIDDDALLQALDTGLVGRATLDATEPEPLPSGHPFYRHPRVRLSPHASVHTPKTPERFATKFAENLARFRGGNALLDRVDFGRGY